MEGMVTTQADRHMRGYPARPHAGLRGGNVFAGWTTTNNFLRHFFVAYDVLIGAGEFKHGLWSWHMENSSLPLWWCELGGQFVGTDGLADTTVTHTSAGGQNPQRNMQAIWDRIDRSPNANKFGPLARAAGLDRLATTAIRVHLHNQAKLWMNRNSSSSPFLTPVTDADGDFEVYLFRSPYTGANMYDAPACPPGTNVTNANDFECGLEHTHVAVIPSASISKKAVAFPSFGLAFDRDTQCPQCMGKSCECDALVVDLAFSAYLTDRDPLELFVPDYVLPSKAAIEGYHLGERGSKA